MDLTELSKSLEELIYDVMIWIIFFPYTLFLVLFRPGKMIAYVGAEMRKDGDNETRFDRGLNPPLFLFLAIIAGWIMSPRVPDSIKQEPQSAVAAAIAESDWNLLLFRMLLFCAFPLAGALIYEWRTPGGIGRESFRQPFYQQAYLCAPVALIISTGFVKLTVGMDELAAGILALVMLGILIWYFGAQIIFYRRTLQSGWPGAILLAICSAALGIGIFLLSFLIV
jgi:UDP-N-acetylmuramyl pentapeptide phosphotransferase/UDP-N-acetylglucosamine-1-phosphate transferase